MHLREIRLVKEENKRLKTENKELRDLCCFLDDDRQRTRRLSREWQRFGRYTSNVMKQEVTAYQDKLKDLERRQNELMGQNAELKQLCLYLDEQRTQFKSLHSKTTAFNSSESSCDGSGRSSDSETHKPEAEQQRRVVGSRDELHCENKLRQLISEPQQDISTGSHETQTSVYDSLASDELFGYIQRLENRVQHLEKSQEFLWRSESNLTSEPEEQHQSKFSDQELPSAPETIPSTPTEQQTIDQNALVDSQTSTGTASSGTTYASTNSDDSAVTAVYVLNDRGETPMGARSGTLTPIDEEVENPDVDPAFTAGDNYLMNLDSLPSLRRFSFSEPSEIFAEKKKEPLSRSHSLNLRRPIDIDVEPMSSSYSCRQQSSNSLAEAVQVLRVQEMAQRNRQRLLTTTETALVHQMCQVAWESLDRQSAQSFEENHVSDSKSNLRMSAV
uniref:Coiled-coil domain-containing protein 85A n=1 Tax=Plectus sambesii TaxID=2011161 RepID=A0A914VMT8_9BILA